MLFTKLSVPLAAMALAQSDFASASFSPGGADPGLAIAMFETIDTNHDQQVTVDEFSEFSGNANEEAHEFFNEFGGFLGPQQFIQEFENLNNMMHDLPGNFESEFGANIEDFGIVVDPDEGSEIQGGTGGVTSQFRGFTGFRGLWRNERFEPIFLPPTEEEPENNWTFEDGVAVCPNWRVINAKCNNVTNKAWGTAGETMPRSVGSTESTTNAGSASGVYANRWNSYGGGANWGNHDPRKVSDSACKIGNDDLSDNGAGATVPDDGARGDSVITYAQVMDHELDATGANDYGSASDSGTDYPFGDPRTTTAPFSGTVGGMFTRTNDSVDNGITSYVDGGIVYGETDDERKRLKESGSSNKLQYTCLEQSSMTGSCTYDKQYLPVSSQICGTGNTCDPDNEFFMANPTKRGCFYAGDFRANENPALVAYHTLFMRMHNYFESTNYGTTCSCFSHDDETNSSCRFETIRHRVGYEEQFITYDEWLPAYTGTWNGGSYSKNVSGETVLQWSSSGTGGMPTHQAYNPSIRGSVRHIFATATFRQHTGVNHTMELTGSNRYLELDQTYFESCVWFGGVGPGCTTQQDSGTDSDTPQNGHVDNLCDIIAGQSTQESKRGDTVMITEERNQLMYKAGNFGNNPEDEIANSTFEGYGGDLASMNIFRGRDHNIAGYRAAFTAYFGSAGAGPQTASEIHTYNGLDSGTGRNGSVNLANAYSTFAAVDVWVGALGEAKLGNGGTDYSMLGTMLTFDVVTQFRDLRDGDRFYRENSALSGYGAPAFCGSVGGLGLSHWSTTLTGASGFVAGTGPHAFKHNTSVTCDDQGSITEHTNQFTDMQECGSGGAGTSSPPPPPPPPPPTPTPPPTPPPTTNNGNSPWLSYGAQK